MVLLLHLAILLIATVRAILLPIAFILWKDALLVLTCEILPRAFPGALLWSRSRPFTRLGFAGHFWGSGVYGWLSFLFLRAFPLVATIVTVFLPITTLQGEKALGLVDAGPQPATAGEVQLLSVGGSWGMSPGE